MKAIICICTDIEFVCQSSHKKILIALSLKGKRIDIY